MHKSLKRKQALRAKAALERTGKLTDRQIEMSVTAILSMPYEKGAAVVDRLEKDPESVLSTIRVPIKRH